ncbi:MAG: threonylcarbamoyl-AMP synthase [Ignavibacteria bacterium]|nr:threonylcarbamoyl-AMP synthase [Ignavibacteria bacterium]
MGDAYISKSKAVEILLSGGVVGVPTETVYGLAAIADDEDAVSTIFQLKGRPSDNPLIVHVSSIHQAERIAWVDNQSTLLMETFWPGPLTLVLPYKNDVCSLARAGLNTVAVRLPDHIDVQDIIAAVGKPLVAPSANKSGRPSPTVAQHVVDDFAGAVAVVDGGPCRIGLESTVVRVTDNNIAILRSGAVIAEDFVKLGFDVRSQPSEYHRSPGTRYRHYAPVANVKLYFNMADLLIAAQTLESVVILAVSNPGLEIPWRQLDATTIYSELRRADALGVKEILVHCDVAVRSNPALMDRLMKASELGTNDIGT